MPTDLERLGSLADDKRRELYEYVIEQGSPVTRDDASAAVGIDRTLAAYHLDKLVDAGLLSTSFARPPGRGGPGAGRPAKHYEAVDHEVAASVPPRDYELIADLLARAIEHDQSGEITRALLEAARDVGRGLTDARDDAGDLWAFLEARGFLPYRDGEMIRLGNCPFHRIARQHTDLVCGANLALLTGALAEIAPDATAELDPGPDRCCVAIQP